MKEGLCQIQFFVTEGVRDKLNSLARRNNTTQQEILSKMLLQYLIQTSPDTADLENITVSCNNVVQQHELEIASINEILKEMKLKRDKELRKILRVRDLYDEMQQSKAGIKMLKMFTRRLDYPNIESAMLNVCDGNKEFIESIFDTDDEEEIIETAISLAHLHVAKEV